MKLSKIILVATTSSILLSGGFIAAEEYTGKVAYAVNLNNTKIDVKTKKGTVKEILAAQNIEISEYDRVEPSLDTKLSAGETINVYKARDITIVDGGVTTTRKTTYKKVEDILKELNITVNADDKVTPDKNSEVAEVDTIKIVRVEKSTQTKKEAIGFDSKEEKDSSKYSDEKTIKVAGKDGEKELTVEVIKEDGKVVSEKTLSEKVITEPTTKIVTVGTKERESTSTEAPANMTGRQITVDAVSYSLGYGNDNTWGRGASGMALGPGVKAIAVDPSVIPLGTRVYVPGYGVAVAADTGSAIKGNIIDVFMSRYADSLAWGRKTITITILD